MEDKKREMKDTITQKSTKEEIANYFFDKFSISEKSKNRIIEEDISGEVLMSLENKDFRLLEITLGSCLYIKKFLEKNKSNFKEEDIKEIITRFSKENEVKMFFEKCLNFKKELNISGKELFELELTDNKMKELGLNLGQRKKLIRYINHFKTKEKEEIILTRNSNKEEVAKFLLYKLSFSPESVKELGLDGENLFELINYDIKDLKELLESYEISENEKNNLINYLIEEKNKKKDENLNKINVETINNKENLVEEVDIQDKKSNNSLDELNESKNNEETTINTESINKENHSKIESQEKKLEQNKKEKGIIFKENIKDEYDYINITIKLKDNYNPKKIEIYSLEKQEKKSYLFIKFEENIYFSVCPIYINSNKIIKFGIRDDNKEILDYNKIDKNFNENLQYIEDNEEKYFQITKNKDKGEYFQIYNEPETLKNENVLLLYLEQLYNLKIYKFNSNIISKITWPFNYEKIIDLILRIGIDDENEEFIYFLVSTLYEKNIDMKQISKYLNRKKNIKNFSKIAPFIIYTIYNKNKSHENNKESKWKNNDHEQFKNEDWILCCNNNITKIHSPKIINKYLLGNTIEILEEKNNNNISQKIKDSIKEKLEKINQNRKEKIFCVLTEQTYKKIYQLELGIKSKIPMIIQGNTSTGKSFLSILALEINEKQYIETALSENTTNEDLLGKNIIKENVIYFCPGILLEAYTEGKTLIINECDLAKPEILSCIVGCLTKEKLIISNKEFIKNSEFNLILTMNGEIKGFTNKQRNILTSDIISKFIIIYFDEIKQEECKIIFYEQIKDIENYNENIKNKIINLHQEMNEQDSNILKKSVDPIVTLRNLKYCTFLGKNNISPRIAVEISYTGRFSFDYRNKNNELKALLNDLGDLQIDSTEEKKLKEELNKNNIFYDRNFLISLYLAKIACENGFHPLLIGKEGCGLSTFAKLLQSIINKNSNKIEENNYLLCNYETTTEDLIGCQKPIIGVEGLSNLIRWVDGPILKAAKVGSPIILDNINYSKTQIIECLNTLLETNFNEKLNFKYSVIQNNEEKEIIVKKNFIIIGTMKDNKNENISKALINRFISIYINEMNINKNNIEELIIKSIKKYNESQNKEENINTNKLHNNINISGKTIDALIKLFKDEKYNLLYEVDYCNYCQNEKFKNDICENCNKSEKFHNLKKLNLKEIIRLIIKLAILHEKLLKYTDLYSMEDCYNLFEFNFDKINKKQTDCLINALLPSERDNKEFFFDFDFDENKPKNESCKMILSLIVSDLTNTSIFIQGSPGSGKTCAAKYYGANRNFQSIDPIITINCHRDLSLGYLLGDYSFQNGKFQFIEGPLLNALKEGYPILLDEFNLCSESLLMNLSPIFKAKINDIIYLKGMDKPEQIKPGFFLITTGNFENEIGRRTIPSFISSEIKTLKIETNELNLDILKEIMEKQYNNINKKDENPDIYKISANQIKEIFEIIYNITQEKFYLRQIKCLLDRIQRFFDTDVFLEKERENCDLKFKDFKIKIPVIYIIISYIFPQLRSNNDIKQQLLEKMNENLKYNNIDELESFINSKVEIEKYECIIENKIEYLNIIKKGKIYLKIEDNFDGENLPQVIKETFFWIRMTCNPRNCEPSNENILLSGLTSYKTYLLYKWLDSLYYNNKEIYDTFYLTQNSETQDLLGVSTLENDEGIEKQINELKNYLKNDGSNNEDYNQKYIKYCIEKLKKKKDSYRKIPIYSFCLGPLTKSYLYGKKIIIKGIENPHPSVIERLNPILENPRNLVLIEDNQKIFNDPEIFKKVYGEESNKTSIPINSRYSLFLTSREIFNEGLSKAFLTRVTIIYCQSYEINKINDLEEDINEDNFIKICSNIFYQINLSDTENETLEEFKKATMNLKNKLEEKIEFEFLKFIRWCKSTFNIYSTIIKNKCNTILYDKKKRKINVNYIVGISALRSIVDDLENDKRKLIINDIQEYLPEVLYNILSGKLKEFIEPFELSEGSNDINLTYIISKISGLSLGISGKPNSDSLKKIKWIPSSLDIADAILTSLVCDSILILEGTPGRGKTEITKIVFEYLNISFKRINFSLSTTKEDVFSRKIPKKNKIVTEKKPLLEILEKTNQQIDIIKNGLILDEINLSPDNLLEQIYSYLIEIKNNKRYMSPDGDTFYEIGKIAVVATLNGSRISNYRISLSNSFLNLTHCFKIPDYTDIEIKNLINILLGPNLKEKEIKKVINCYLNSKTYAMENEIITFREILKLKEMLEKYGFDKKLELFLELIFCPYIESSEINNFKATFEDTMRDFKDVELKINSKKIYFREYIEYPRIQNNYNKINYNFTLNQKEAIIKILFGLSIKKTILLTGEIGCGKTFLIEKLAELIGAKLKIIQFHSEISSYDIIGGQEIVESKTDEIFNKLKEYENILIEQKYTKITQFIEFIETKNYNEIIWILNESLKDIDISKNPSIKKEDIKDLITQLKEKNKLNISNFNLKFKKSFLLDAIENGYWILLDDTNLKPQELERLMSLLEEEPELNVFEENIKYKKNANKNEKKIHDNFRLIISTSNENKISSPLKSRCFKVKMNNFNKTEDYAILISNYLSNSNFYEKDLEDISINVGKLFNILKNNENVQEEDYLLKNYFLSSVKIFNFFRIQR